MKDKKQRKSLPPPNVSNIPSCCDEHKARTARPLDNNIKVTFRFRKSSENLPHSVLETNVILLSEYTGSKRGTTTGSRAKYGGEMCGYPCEGCMGIQRRASVTLRRVTARAYLTSEMPLPLGQRNRARCHCLSASAIVIRDSVISATS